VVKGSPASVQDRSGSCDPKPPQAEPAVTASGSVQDRVWVSPSNCSTPTVSRDVGASGGLAEMTMEEIDEQRRQEEAERANRSPMVRASRRTVEDFLDPSFGRRLVSDAGDQGLLGIVGQGLQRLTAGRLKTLYGKNRAVVTGCWDRKIPE
jgi:hypothetical protein